jgi:hypothetical protein
VRTLGQLTITDAELHEGFAILDRGLEITDQAVVAQAVREVRAVDARTTPGGGARTG